MARVIITAAHAAHDNASAWAPALQALAGGLIAGAVSVATIFFGHRADAKKRDQEWKQAQEKADTERRNAKRDARETELREGVRCLRVSAFRCVTAASDFAHAILDTADDDTDQSAAVEPDPAAAAEFGERYLAAREESENLRAISRAPDVRTAVDSLIEKLRDLHAQTESPPDDRDAQNTAIHDLSRQVSDLVRQVSDAIDEEIQSL